MKLYKITETIEKYAPLSIAFDWDNSGLQIGRSTAQINSVLVCLDVTERTVKEAMANHCELIISHHPLLFNPLKNITDDAKSDIIRVAIKNNISIYSSHTPFDMADCGINRYIAHKFEMENTQYLQSYENGTGIGLIGGIDSLRIDDFIEKIKDVYSTEYIRTNYDGRDMMVNKIAICCGSGSEFIPEAAKMGANVLITSDCKMNHFLTATELSLTLADVTHFKSERFFIRLMSRLLSESLPELTIYESGQPDPEVLV